MELECFSRASSYATQTMLSENSRHPLADLSTASSGARPGPFPRSDTMASPTHPVPSESFPVSLVHRLPPHTLLLLSNKCLCMAPSPASRSSVPWTLPQVSHISFLWCLGITCLHNIFRNSLLSRAFTVQCAFLQAKLCVLPWPCSADKLTDHSLLSTQGIHQLCFEMHI